jgi:hypothetical protein
VLGLRELVLLLREEVCALDMIAGHQRQLRG